MSEDRLVPLSSNEGPERSSRAKRAFQGSVANELRVEVGPRRVGQMLDQALELFRGGFFRYVLIATLIVLPERIMQAFFGAHIIMGPESMNGEFNPLMMIGFFATLFFTVVTYYLAHLMTAQMAYNDLHGKSEPVLIGLVRIVKRSPGLFIAILLVVLGQSAGLIACLVGALFAVWKLHLIPYAYLIEGRTLSQSIQRGWDLSVGGFYRFWGVYVVLAILTGMWSQIGTVPFQPDFREPVQDFLRLHGVAFDILFVPLTAVLNAVATAAAGIAWVVYYSDQRVRLEGLDLELRLDEIESNVSVTEAPV